MPEMVMQMPGRHGSLSAPFLMDQIIQTASRTKAPLCRTSIRNPKEHFCSLLLTLVGDFLKHATMRGALFKDGASWSPSRHQKHNGSLFPPRRPDPCAERRARSSPAPKTSGVRRITDPASGETPARTGALAGGSQRAAVEWRDARDRSSLESRASV